MTHYQQSFQEEKEYLEKTINLIKAEISRQMGLLSDRKDALREAGKDMWENSVHFTKDFERLTEVVQRLNEVSNETAIYRNTVKQLEKYKRMLKEPYFGRFDFIEEETSEAEKIYIGLHSAIDSKTHEIMIYDWRAPISSIFYQYELGRAEYKAPYGIISGKVSLKRQYKLQNSELKYFFDCSIKIDDEMLQDVLSHNSSTKMRNIVETIQREQDTIIRDTDNELLIVQGVAGSGKTSVALHRIAYLLYNGMNLNINNQNIVIISPNAVFSKYISDVLPELGEENVEQITFEDLTQEALKGKGQLETRAEQLEELIVIDESSNLDIKSRSIEFKWSEQFIELLYRFISHYERHMLTFEDLYYAGKVIESRHLLKNSFLDNKINMPMSKRLERLENIILDKIRPLQRERVKKIEKLVQKMDGHEFDIKPFSRLLSIKESKAFLRRVRRFTEIDYYEIYRLLFNEKGLINYLSKGRELPEDIEQIIKYTKDNLERKFTTYEDSAAMLYLKLKLEGNEKFSGIRHVVVDEAQDYTPLQYEIFKMLFKDAGFTVLGDINQSIEKTGDVSQYDNVIRQLNKRKWLRITLKRSYRSSFEISNFAQKLLIHKQDIIPFERYETEPDIVYKETTEEIEAKIMSDVDDYMKQGYESIAVICKTVKEAENLYERLKKFMDIILIKTDDEVKKGIVILPSYMAKGLEFDVVLVFNVSKENYRADLDRRLLYIACTRALHRLKLYYTGEKSSFI